MKESAKPKGARAAREARESGTPKAAKAPNQLALLCLSGKQTGQETMLPADRPLIIGRSRQADIRLEDDLASRQHTKIAFEDDKYVVEDLGSKNGTYLNGQKVGRAVLKTGDYIRIGDSNFHVVMPCVVEEKARAWWEKTQYTLATMKIQPDRNAGAASSISGSLAEVSLIDLVQLLSNAMKTGLVTIRCGQDKGEIYLRDGQLYYAMINHTASAHPEKVVYRILRWKEGAFTFTANAEHVVQNEITEPTSSLLLEGVRQADELSAFENSLPKLSSELHLAAPLPEPLRHLKPEELDMVQLVHEKKTFLKLLDASPGSDLEVCTTLVTLLNRKVLVAKDMPEESKADEQSAEKNPESPEK